MNQSPSNWVGTGPPGGGLGAADGVGCVAEDVDWPHEEARKTTAVASRAAIAGEPIHRGVVMVRPRGYNVPYKSGANGDPNVAARKVRTSRPMVVTGVAASAPRDLAQPGGG